MEGEPTHDGEVMLTKVGVLDKSMLVLRTIERQGPLTLLELQHATGLPRATLHRLAVALETHRLLRRTADGAFCLGLDFLGFSTAAIDTFPIVGLARQPLQRLNADSGESAQLYVRDGDGRRCALSLPSRHQLRWMVPEGALLPMHVGSAAHVLAGECGPHGWVESVEEREPGVASVSAPVRVAGGSVVAAVSIGGPMSRMGPSPGDRFGSMVVATADEVARLL